MSTPAAPSASPPAAPADERLPLLLSLNGGYVDTLGFIALHGLFSAHVTGNFVAIGYALGNGASGAWTKLAALPVFCLGVFLARLYGQARRDAGKPAFMRLLTVKTLLLCVAAALAVTLGPFPMGDSWGLFATGMTLVLAMSIQNAVHRVHLGAAPPSTLMTGTTTQIMLDLADTVRGEADAAAGRLTVKLDIVPDEDEPYAVLSAYDESGEQLAEIHVAPTYKLSVQRASEWARGGFGREG